MEAGMRATSAPATLAPRATSLGGVSRVGCHTPGWAQTLLLSLEVTLKGRHSGFEQCLRALRMPDGTPAGITNAHLDPLSLTRAFNAELPAEGGSLYRWAIVRQIVYNGEASDVAVAKQELRASAQRALNATTGRKSIRQIEEDEKVYGIARARPVGEEFDDWHRQWDVALEHLNERSRLGDVSDNRA